MGEWQNDGSNREKQLASNAHLPPPPPSIQSPHQLLVKLPSSTLFKVSAPYSTSAFNSAVQSSALQFSAVKCTGALHSAVQHGA